MNNNLYQVLLVVLVLSCCGSGCSWVKDTMTLRDWEKQRWADCRTMENRGAHYPNISGEVGLDWGINGTKGVVKPGTYEVTYNETYLVHNYVKQARGGYFCVCVKVVPGYVKQLAKKKFNWAKVASQCEPMFVGIERRTEKKRLGYEEETTTKEPINK